MRNGRAGRMRGQEMSKNTKTSRLSEAWALNVSIADANRVHVGALSVNSNGHGERANVRKTLSL